MPGSPVIVFVHIQPGLLRLSFIICSGKCSSLFILVQMKDCIVYENYLIYMNRINLWFKIFGYILMDLLKIKQPMFYDLVLTSIDL